MVFLLFVVFKIMRTKVWNKLDNCVAKCSVQGISIGS